MAIFNITRWRKHHFCRTTADSKTARLAPSAASSAPKSWFHQHLQEINPKTTIKKKILPKCLVHFHDFFAHLFRCGQFQEAVGHVGRGLAAGAGLAHGDALLQRRHVAAEPLQGPQNHVPGHGAIGTVGTTWKFQTVSKTPLKKIWELNGFLWFCLGDWHLMTWGLWVFVALVEANVCLTLIADCIFRIF